MGPVWRHRPKYASWPCSTALFADISVGPDRWHSYRHVGRSSQSPLSDLTSRNQRDRYGGDHDTCAGAGTFEHLNGIANCDVDSLHPDNDGIVDLAFGPRQVGALITFEVDFSVVLPADSARGNRRTVVMLDCAPRGGPMVHESHVVR